MAKVLNRKNYGIHGRRPFPPEDTWEYIGRPTKWGNPYPITAYRSRKQAVAAFENYLLEHPELVGAAKQELRGKDLLCFCAPLACHGDVLLEIANG